MTLRGKNRVPQGFLVAVVATSHCGESEHSGRYSVWFLTEHDGEVHGHYHPDLALLAC